MRRLIGFGKEDEVMGFFCCLAVFMKCLNQPEISRHNNYRYKTCSVVLRREAVHAKIIRSGELLSEQHMGKIAELFNIRINIWLFRNMGRDRFVKYKSPLTGKELGHVHLLWYEHQYFLIPSIESFRQISQCKDCPAFFTKPCNLHRHETSCMNREEDSWNNYTKLFPGGKYQPKKTLIDSLESQGINIPDTSLILKMDFAVWDCESLTSRMDTLESGDVEEGMVLEGQNEERNLEYTQKHKVISMSIACTFAAERSFISFDGSSTFIEDALKHLLTLAEYSASEALKQAEPVLDQISNFKIKAIADEKPWLVKKMEKIEKHLTTYLKRFVIVGYNSQNYDIPACLSAGLAWYCRS